MSAVNVSSEYAGVDAPVGAESDDVKSVVDGAAVVAGAVEVEGRLYAAPHRRVLRREDAVVGAQILYEHEGDVVAEGSLIGHNLHWRCAVCLGEGFGEALGREAFGVQEDAAVDGGSERVEHVARIVAEGRPVGVAEEADVGGGGVFHVGLYGVAHAVELLESAA